jgi:hypothetical protein
MATLHTEATESQILLPFGDPTGKTEILDTPCPNCGTTPAPLRVVTTRVSSCRFCRCFVQQRPDGTLVPVLTDKRIRRGSELEAGHD